MGGRPLRVVRMGLPGSSWVCLTPEGRAEPWVMFLPTGVGRALWVRCLVTSDLGAHCVCHEELFTLS